MISKRNSNGVPKGIAGAGMASASGQNTGKDKYQKRIGSTTYLISVCFSKTSQETAADILQRLIAREAVKTA